MDELWSRNDSSGINESIEAMKLKEGSRRGAPRPLASGRSFTSSALSQKPELDLELFHGVVAGARMISDQVLRRVLLLRERNSLLALDTRGVQMWDARRMPSRQAELEVNDMIYAHKTNRFVAYERNKIKLLNDSFEVIHESASSFNILCAVYNSLTNEIITCGMGNITMWMFRRGAKVLVSRQEIKDGLSSTDELSAIHLEKVASRTQRGFTSCRSNVLIYNLHDGQHLKTLKNLHQRPITCLLYYPQFGYLVTAAKDGSVKIWDNQYQLLHVLVSHKQSITCMAMHPYDLLLLTGSADTTIRLWNIETGTETGKLETNHPVEGLITFPQYNQFYSFSTMCINTWTINHLHDFLIRLGSPVMKLKNTSHPRVPLRLIASCANSTVHVLSPVSGVVISSALLSVGEMIEDVAYASEQEELYVLLKSGSIATFNTNYHPAKQMKSIEISKGKCSCLTIYEYTLDEEMLQELIECDKWFGVAMSVIGKDIHARQDRTLLLAGLTNGQIIVINRKTRAINFTTRAHEGTVTAIVGNPRRDLIVSSGTDDVLRVWKLSPFVQDVISPLLSFYCAYPTTHVSLVADKFLSVFQNVSTVTYTVAAFSVSAKRRCWHDTDMDHDDAIVDLACCPKLCLFATCSVDGTIRVWSDEGKLLRVVYLNATPEGISFSSIQGDLTVAIAGQLHTINFIKFLPKTYLEQLVTMHLPAEKAEYSHQPAAGSSLNNDRLIPGRTTPLSARFTPASEVPSLLESEEYKQEQRMKEETIAQLAARNVEINQIRDGVYGYEKKKFKSRDMWREVWERYWTKVGPRRTSVQVSVEDDFNPDTYGREALQSKLEDPYQRSESPSKFFPPVSPYYPPYPIAPDGHLPNSVLLREFLKGLSLTDVRERWKPKMLSTDQLAELMAKKQQDQTDEEFVDEGYTAEWDSDEKQGDETDFMAKLKAAMAEREKEESSPETTPEPEPVPKWRPKKLMPLSKVVKFMAPKSKTPPPPLPSPPPAQHKESSPPPPPEHSRSHTPLPPTPLPEFIAQFMSESWFTHFFPDASSTNFPKPWTVNHFVDMVISCMRRASLPEMKTSICKAIDTLREQHGVTRKAAIIRELFDELNCSSPPNAYLDHEKEFILEVLHMLFTLEAFTPQFVIELMVQYLDGDDEMRQVVAAYFLSLGLNDSNMYFIPKELDSFEIWGLEEENRKGQLIQMSADWLEHWTSQYQQHSLDGVKGGAGTKSQLSSHSRSSRGAGKQNKQRQHGRHTATLNDDDSPKPIDVINYFVVIAHAKEMERLKLLATRPPTVQSTTVEPKKDTILTLPQIHKTSLARLGETHCSKCHPERETSLAITHLPLIELKTNYHSLLNGFSRCLSLTLRPNVVMPFIEEEEVTKNQTRTARFNGRQVLSLASTSKYFFPDRSYVYEQ